MGAATLLCIWLTAFLHVFSSVHGGYAGIVNGTVSKPRPYMVSVQKVNQKERNKGMQHNCGGFLVSDSFVMTAAHCVAWGENLTVVVGGLDISTNTGTRIPVKYYHINPGYNSDTLQNDIALLQLDKVIKKSKTVDWISFPDKDKEIKAASVCSVAGWGRIKTGGKASNLLLQADVVVMKRQKCRNFWNKYFTAKMLCTGGEAGFCQGDSGGPLVCNKKAVGIVSFNQENNCDKPIKPNVYTKISSYLPWIKAILKSV